MDPQPDVRLVFEGETGQWEMTWVLRVQFTDGHVRFVRYRAWQDGGNDLSEAVPGTFWDLPAPGRVLGEDERKFFCDWVAKYASELRLL